MVYFVFQMMKMASYYIFYGFVKLFSLLPLRILYLFSDVFYFILRYLVPYRKKMVFKNLRNAFPEKNEQEIKMIAFAYYRYFADYTIEIIALLSMKLETGLKRFKVKNPGILDPYYEKKQSVVIVSGHYANWEWGSFVDPQVKHQFTPLYKPLHSKLFDRFFIHLREKHGNIMVTGQHALKYMIKNKDLPSIYWFLADQRPLRKDIHFWTTFLNQDTPVFLGAEKIATKLDMPVFFIKINLVKRGYYEVEFVKLVENPKSTKKFEITRNHTRFLEQQILENPALWAWSHNRWKHKKLS